MMRSSYRKIFDISIHVKRRICNEKVERLLTMAGQGVIINLHKTYYINRIKWDFTVRLYP